MIRQPHGARGSCRGRAGGRGGREGGAVLVNPARWGGQRQECWQDTDEQHPVGLSHSPPSAGPVPEVVLKNNNKEVERNHDSCCEISKRWPVTEMKVGWSPQGFGFPFRSLGGC